MAAKLPAGANYFQRNTLRMRNTLPSRFVPPISPTPLDYLQSL